MKKIICDNFKKPICSKCGKPIINNKGDTVRVSACAEDVKHITCE